MTYQSVNPYDGKILATFTEFSGQELESALARAAGTALIWRDWSFSQRAAVVAKAALILSENSDEYARLITLEMGKLIEQARGEIKLSADILSYYAQHAEQFLLPELLQPVTGSARVESFPLGVLLGIQPWNFPYYQLARFAAPNIMAGNVVMVKHAAGVPQCAMAFEKLWQDAGAPAGVYTNLIIAHQQVNNLIDDPRIKGIALTGSVEAGRLVAERAGKNLKKTTMELGGSDAFIVLADADLDAAVKWAVAAKMNNCGQSCVAAKRFIVVEPVADRFLEQFCATLKALKPGDPMSRITTLGPMSSEGALLKLVDQVEKAVAHGATVLLGGERISGGGAFMAPTVLTDITPSNPAYFEEFFGPVALYFRVKDTEQALALANDSPFGLGGAIFTRDEAAGQQLARRLDAGMVFVNNPTGSTCDLPFGGIKNSGYGRELSRAGIQEFVNKKLVRVAPADAPA